MTQQFPPPPGFAQQAPGLPQQPAQPQGFAPQAPGTAPAQPQGFAPQAPGTAQPWGAPGTPAVPQAQGSQAAPQAQNFGQGQSQAQPWDPALGNAIANATVGIQRLPPIPAGNHLLKVIKTLAPENSRAMIAELEVVQSDTAQPGEQYSWFQSLDGGNPRTAAAQNGAVLTFILRCAGFADKESAAAQGITPEALAQTVNQCAVEPGPLVGRLVACRGVDTGKISAKGFPIIDESFNVYQQ